MAAAAMEMPGIVDLEVLAFDQEVNSKALSDGQGGFETVIIGLEVELEVASSAGK